MCDLFVVKTFWARYKLFLYIYTQIVGYVVYIYIHFVRFGALLNGSGCAVCVCVCVISLCDYIFIHICMILCGWSSPPLRARSVH